MNLPVQFYLHFRQVQGIAFARHVSSDTHVTSQAWKSYIETEVAVLLITGENFNISWLILREQGRVQSSGLKFGIIIGSSSILIKNLVMVWSGQRTGHR